MPTILRATPINPAQCELRFPYSAELVAMLKEFGGARFNGNKADPAWVVGTDLIPILESKFGKHLRWQARPVASAPPPELHEHPLFEKLRPYQKEGAAFLASHLHAKDGALLADDVGIGKTLQALAASTVVPPGVRLLICPNNATDTWRNEIPKWLGNVPIYFAIGRDHQFVEMAGAGGKTLPLAKVVPAGLGFGQSYWFICHFEVLLAWDNWLSMLDPRLVVMDEAHAFTNRKTQRTQSLFRLKANTNATTWALTATPLRSGPKNLWSMVESLRPGAFGGLWHEGEYKGFWKWASRYCSGGMTEAKAEYTDWDDSGSSNEDELKLRLNTFMLRRAREAVLPEIPVQRRYTEVFLDSAQRLKYSKLEAKLCGRLEGSTASPESLEPLCQLTSAIKLPIAVGRAIEIARAGHKIILFTHFHDTVDALQKAFAKLLKDEVEKPSVVCVPGTIAPAGRIPLFKRWSNAQGGAILVANTLSSGVSTNALMAASFVIFLDQEWIPDDLVQAEGRVLRFGQEQKIDIEYLVCAKTVDEAMAKMIVERLNRVDAIVGMGKQAKGLREKARNSGLVDESSVGMSDHNVSTVAEALKAMRQHVAMAEKQTDEVDLIGGKETDFLLDDEDEEDASIPF